MSLQLTITDYQNETRWRWVLSDEKGNFLTDHEVSLDANAPVYRGFKDLPGYLRHHIPATPAAQVLREVGEWMGEKVFGGLADALRERMQSPATVVRVSVPKEAQDLLFRPFELAHLDGKPFAEHGLRFVYQLADARPPTTTKPTPAPLRVLAVFSLPDEANPLNLRRERYQLKRLLDQIAQTHGVAIAPLRVIQYGATRQTLQDALEEGDGWDIIHFSGHGLEGQLLLENERGEMDLITADKLAPLLRPTKGRLKLLTLSACFSGAASLQAARAQLGLDDPTRAETPPPPTPPAEGGESTNSSPLAGEVGWGVMPTSSTLLPSLAQTLAQELDCAALAMRYPVGDEFATHLMLSLYELLLEKGQPLPGALQLALNDALTQTGAGLPLSPVTPILFGARAVDLTLTPPTKPPRFELPVTGLLNFPPEPERFVGRLTPMLRASQSLAPQSPHRGVLFYGMAGAGKTHCALELAYRHEADRFQGDVWHKAPDEGHDITTALVNFLQDVEAQLDIHDAALTAHVDDPTNFQRRTLPRLKFMLSQNALLIVLDNIESLLTSSGQWRDPKWGGLMNALLSHTGASRVVLTSRRLPATLANHPALLRLPIHALDLRESVLLARELPNLRPLFDTPQGRELLRRTLNAVQGHPKLLDLADRRAADAAALEQLLAQTEQETAPQGDILRDFFETGESKQGEENFVATLRNWTTSLTATLPATARLLFHFLCRLEDPDRQSDIIEANWKDFLNRLKDTTPAARQGHSERSEESHPSEMLHFVQHDTQAAAATALTEPGTGLETSLELLITSGLVESRVITVPAADASSLIIYRIHPAVAQAALAEADPAALNAADIELGDFWIAMFMRGIKTELQGGGGLVVESGKRAAPYLLRARRWEEAATLLERVIQRDTTSATLAMALPLLRQIAEATKGTDRELIDACVLANALLNAGRYSEAESMLRDLIEKCVAQGDYRLASVNAGTLLNLLRETGRLEEALSLAERKADFTRRAGLGPWMQLADEGGRLGILNAMGHYAEVLEAVRSLRRQLATLPEESEAKATVVAWHVRETLLNTGAYAAMQLKQWEAALSLNAKIVQFKQQRGADEVEIARTLFNDYGPFLRLRRYRETRALLEVCRAAFEEAHAIFELGGVFHALADLEDAEGNSVAAVRFEHIALRYCYQAGHPEDCAQSHNNLARYLSRTQAAPEVVLAHQLADALICFQTGSGGLATTLSSLANSTLPAAPPTFDEVADIVEKIEGVKFRDLFARLPQREPNGDAAIAAVWEMAQREQARRQAEAAQRDALLSALPPVVRAAIEAEDGEALKTALEQLPSGEAQATLEQLTAAGIISVRTEKEVDAAQLLASLPPIVRAALEARDEAALNAALGQLAPEEQQRVVAALKALFAQAESEEGEAETVDVTELLASLPPAVRDAIQAGDEEAFIAAMSQLSPEEAMEVVQKLRAAGLIA